MTKKEEKRRGEPPEMGKPARCHLEVAQAHWVSRDTILWRVAGNPSYTYQLHTHPAGGLTIEGNQVTGVHQYRLTYEPDGAEEAISQKFPHLKDSTTLKLGEDALSNLPDLLKGQVAVSAHDQNGNLVGVTLFQIPGVLDDVFSYTGPLGVSHEHGEPILRLWAPTAIQVRLHLYPHPQSRKAAQTIDMTWDPANGVWSAHGTASWIGMFYLYEVEVYVPRLCRVERNFVTDPYSISLCMNSKRSQIVDLASPELFPANWKYLKKPTLEAFEDTVIYELHVRDFSIRDESVPPALRGTYLAFTVKNSYGMKHLRALAKAGLTHIHLMPVFDFASVNDDKSKWEQVDGNFLRSFPPDSSEQQNNITKIQDSDGFNWGYDPYHYTVPEGSYATDPDGSARILEFRKMVQALNNAGLRVIMDVVYNHTFASGVDEKSVLDKVVPGYYHRLNGDGLVENSTCCSNTATEHAMMEKLMIDSLVTWAKAYKVDGFRFDLMGHHMVSNLDHARQALDGLTLEKDGVEGSKIILYGEAWDFGEVWGGGRGKNASQRNIGGSGIGAFNDRMRDAIRGGRPFGAPQDQGFITGLFTEPNLSDQGTLAQQKDRLLHTTDWIRLGLAGNLNDYRFVNTHGYMVSGREIEYHGQSAAYTQSPQENVIFISAHDNETLFDAIQLKAPPTATLADRIRMHWLGLSLVILGQGIPFFLAGDDMLRSKSLDRNSYNSGDWFNALDFSYATNNWGVGLPPGENRHHWHIMAPLLADPKLKPNQAQIIQTTVYFRELLRIRKSSRLFRLRSAREVKERVQFYLTGPSGTPGVIVMGLASWPETRSHDGFDQILVIFNAWREEQVITEEKLKRQDFRLHPIQAVSVDKVVQMARYNPYTGTFIVPGRTAAVFVSGKARGVEEIINTIRRRMTKWFPALRKIPQQ